MQRRASTENAAHRCMRSPKGSAMTVEKKNMTIEERARTVSTGP